jgi:transcriptional regulator with XRE-family HTH domain
MISARQIRAGRALLGWTAQELADRAGMSIDAVLRLESERVSTDKARAGTIAKLTKALEDGGVELLPRDGVCLRLDQPE